MKLIRESWCQPTRARDATNNMCIKLRRLGRVLKGGTRGSWKIREQVRMT